MHQFGDVVTMVRPDGKGGVQKINALVAQAQAQTEGDHLTLVFLDPAQASPILAGAAVDKAITKAFVTPAVDGKQYGWEEPEKVIGDAALIDQIATQKQAIKDLQAKADELTTALKQSGDELTEKNEALAAATTDLASAREVLTAMDAKVDAITAERDEFGKQVAAGLELSQQQAEEIAQLKARPEPSAPDPTGSTATGPSAPTPTTGQPSGTEGSGH